MVPRWASDVTSVAASHGITANTRGGTMNRYGDKSRFFSMRYENRYLVTNIDILVNVIRFSK